MHQLHATDNVSHQVRVTIGRKVVALLALTRFPATLVTAILVGILAARFAGAAINQVVVLSAALAYLFVSGAGFAINDYFDIEIDRVNKPHRPLPAGIIKPTTALTVFCGMLAVAVALSLWIGAIFASITIPNACLLVVYSGYFKTRGGILANILMGIYAALVVLSGVAALGNVSNMVVLYATSLFLYMVGTQIVMCVEDIEGDRAEGARTLPASIGIHRSLTIALSLQATAIAMLVAISTRGPALVLTALILLLNAYLFARLIASPVPSTARKLRFLMALSMVLTIVVVIARGNAVGPSLVTELI